MADAMLDHVLLVMLLRTAPILVGAYAVAAPNDGQLVVRQVRGTTTLEASLQVPGKKGQLVFPLDRATLYVVVTPSAAHGVEAQEPARKVPAVAWKPAISTGFRLRLQDWVRQLSPGKYKVSVKYSDAEAHMNAHLIGEHRSVRVVGTLFGGRGTITVQKGNQWTLDTWETATK